MVRAFTGKDSQAKIAKKKNFKSRRRQGHEPVRYQRTLHKPSLIMCSLTAEQTGGPQDGQKTQK